MKNKKLSTALFVLTIGMGFGASHNAFAASCSALFQACEYHNNPLACITFDESC